MIRAEFNGIGCLGAVSFSLRQGVTPSTGSIAFPANSYPHETGDLLLRSENGAIILRDMYLVDPVESEAEGGHIIQATLADKRILWQYGWVRGEYNMPDETTGQPRKEKTIRELIDLCLETKYGVRVNYHSVPNYYPTVSWEFENPAMAVQEICNKYGLAVSLSPDGEVHVSSASYGRSVPGGYIMSREQTTLNKPVPQSIVVVGNKMVNQREYDLVPVGVEWSGHSSKAGFILPIDDLSYKPSAGWGKSILIKFHDVAEGEKRELALKCIFKWYGYLGGYGANAREFCLPWLGHIKDLTAAPNISGVDDEQQRAKPDVKVKGFESDGVSHKNQSAKTQRKIPYTLDYKRGIVKFAEWTGIIIDPGTGEPATDPMLHIHKTVAADVTITAAHETPCIQVSGSVWGNYYYQKSIPGGTLPPYLYRDHSITLYANNGTADSSQKSDLDAHCKNIAYKITDQFDRIDPKQYVYAELLSVTPHGEIKSVTWNVGENGYNTVISYGQEEIRPFLPSYNERINAKKTVALQWPTGRTLENQQNLKENIRRASL